MLKKIGHISLLVRDYDEAIDFYVGKLGFELVADNAFGPDMRWVAVAPSKNAETAIVFVQADTPDKEARVGAQASNHVFLVVHTDDCRRDHEAMKSRGVVFFGEPQQVPWGVEVVFEDLYGNRLDLVEHNGY